MLKKSLSAYSLASSKSLSFLQILLASCFIALCAQIKIPLYFTPVPLTFQGVGILLVALMLGGKKGALATGSYLLQGALGLPVWAGGISSGIFYLLGPTGGYLFAYVLQAYFVGFFSEKFLRTSFVKLFCALVLSVFFHLLLGSLWLSYFVGIDRSLQLGMFPFLFLDCAKALGALGLIQMVKKHPLNTHT